MSTCRGAIAEHQHAADRRIDCRDQQGELISSCPTIAEKGKASRTGAAGALFRPARPTAAEPSSATAAPLPEPAASITRRASG
jgi:hypothetical protein